MVKDKWEELVQAAGQSIGLPLPWVGSLPCALSACVHLPMPAKVHNPLRIRRQGDIFLFVQAAHALRNPGHPPCSSPGVGDNVRLARAAATTAELPP